MLKKLFLSFAVLGVAVALAACTPSPATTNQAEAASVADWLTQSGVKMYGAWWCPHCADQKAIFGDAFKKVTYIECANPDKSQNATCQAAGIQSYPTWQFADGTRVSQVLTIDQLKQKSNYPGSNGTAGPTAPVTTQ